MNSVFELVTEETVDLDGMIGVGRVDRAKDIDVHAVPVQQARAAHDFVERALTALVHAIGVVHFARPVHAQPDEDAVRLEKRAPCLVQARAIRLDGVGDVLARPLVLLHILNRPLKEVEAHQCGLAALPANDHLGAGCDSSNWQI